MGAYVGSAIVVVQTCTYLHETAQRLNNMPHTCDNQASSKLDAKYMVGMLVFFRHSNQECFVSEKSSMASYVSPKGWNVVA